MHWWSNDASSWWNWTLMIIGMVAFWAFIWWAVVAIFSSSDGTVVDSRRTPEQILAERFAAGEIDIEEFNTRLDALRVLTRPTH